MNLDVIRKMDRIHSYPAKFTIDLAMKFVEKLTKPGDVVYDPFLGSGTTLLAAKLLGRNGYGTDINHIAILISKFKLLDLNKANFKHLGSFIEDFKTSYKEEIEKIEPYSYPSINHWFCDDSIKILTLIRNKILLFKNEKEKTFSELVMSSIVNLASNQESDTRYAAIDKPKLNIDYVAQAFIKKFESTLELYEEFNKEISFDVFETAELLNAKQCTSLFEKNSIDLILTSPPYPNTYDYYLYHKHRMNWLGYDVNFSKNNEIGSRREFSSLKQPKEKFNEDMFDILSECNKGLKRKGYAVLVMGDGKIQGKVYEAKSNMATLCRKLNWKLVDYSYSLLDETSRSFQKSYRTKGKKEHVLVFQKEA